MISDEFTPAAMRALDAAQAFSRKAGNTAVMPLHLLQGILEEEEGLAAQLLASAGLNVTVLRHNLACDQKLADESAAEKLPWDPASERIIAGARILSRDAGGDYAITGTLLLLSLARQEKSLRQVLESHGLDFARMEREFHATQGPPLRLEEDLNLEAGPDGVDAHRVLDANFNRAREALRVLDDYCRFILEDAFLSGGFKQLRHDLAAIAESYAQTDLLSSRDTPGDVGATLTTSREHHRDSASSVAITNSKRLQEALRSLEEFAKLTNPEDAKKLEALRYQAYTLEKGLAIIGISRQRLASAQLYVLLTGESCAASLDWTFKEAAAGGADIFQLREKNLDDRALLDRARQMRKWTRQAGTLFIVNDRPDLARLVGADGVHVGQEDLPVHEARRIVGPGCLIGVSTHTVDQVKRAILDGADYIAVGPAFASVTKEFEMLAGLEFVQEALALTSLPAFVIGGINDSNLDQIIARGGKRIAVSAAICKADDPQLVARRLKQRLPK